MLKDYTTEHVMPQDRDLSEEWQRGVRQKLDEEVQKKYLHTIGNLTLTKHNSKLGNRSFTEKKLLVVFSIVHVVLGSEYSRSGAMGRNCY